MKKNYDKIALNLLTEYKKITRTEEQIHFFEDLLMKEEKAPDGLLILFYKGYLYYLRQEFENAEKYFLSTLDIIPHFYFAHYCLGNTYLEMHKYRDAIKIFKIAININENCGYAFNGLGNVYIELQAYSKAKTYFLKATKIDDKDYFAWIGLGKIFNLLGKYEDAIKAFNRAINIFPDFYHAYSGLGYSYRYLKEFDKAEVEYLKAIKIEPSFSPIWEGLGIVYKNLTNIKDGKAIDAYKKSIELDKTYASGYLGLGFLFFAAENKKKESLENFINAKKYYNKPEDEYFASVAKYHIDLLTDEIKFDNIIKNDKTIHLPKDPLIKILMRTHQLEVEILKKQKSFLKWIVTPQKIKAHELYFKVLRRWNSYTPIVADNYNISKGGGYFLKAFGKGIVIDPGFNFIENFKGAGHYFDEIDFVFISHAHNDHTSDMESILTLLHLLNQSRKGKERMYFSDEETTRHDLAKETKAAIEMVNEKEIEEKFSKSQRRKIIHFYFTKSVAKKFGGMLNLFDTENYIYHILEADDKKVIIKPNNKIEIGENLIVETISASHDDIISTRDSVGFIFHIQDKMLIYTGDTGWNPKIENKYKLISKKYKGKQIILLCHLGGFKAEEGKYITREKRNESFYKQHLGRLGIGKIIQTLKPYLCLISEFGEELKNNRAEICKLYQEIFPDTIFIPADIGLDYRFKTNQIKAITKINIIGKDYEEELTEPSLIETFLLKRDYSLHYYSKNNDINEDDLGEVLSYKYDKSSK